MKFRTEYRAEQVSPALNPREGAVLLGSCFSAEIGGRMQRALWEACVNPCGALYNPATIAQIITLALADRESQIQAIDTAMFEKDGVFLSFLFDTTVHAADCEEYRNKALGVLDTLRDTLNSSGVLIITLGTSYIYRHRGLDITVTNCHKFPAATFERRLLGIDEITSSLRDAITLLPHKRIIITVSPVRHLADGFHGNAISKAQLLMSAEILAQERALTEYFPAYEILLDDLRDYRFYASDLAHPSAEAADYIWELFKHTYLDKDGLKRVAEGEKLYARLQHRPLIAGTPSDLRFREETRRLVNAFLTDNKNG